MAKKLLLIDGDILLYKAMTTAEKEVQWDEDVWVMWCDLGTAKETFVVQLCEIMDSNPLKGYEPFLCFTDAANFRKEVYPAYKSNRKAQRKPMAFREFKQWVLDSSDNLLKPALEADDCLGILATKPNSDTIIWSIDKDLMQIPGKHLVDGKIVEVSQEEGDTKFYTQTLMGDPVDGYPGCPGIGPKTAEKVLQVAANPWEGIVEAYAAKGLTAEDALVQARCARILRWEDWDSKKQEVKLWVPPTV